MLLGAGLLGGVGFGLAVPRKQTIEEVSDGGRERLDGSVAQQLLEASLCHSNHHLTEAEPLDGKGGGEGRKGEREGRERGEGRGEGKEERSHIIWHYRLNYGNTLTKR